MSSRRLPRRPLAGLCAVSLVVGLLSAAAGVAAVPVAASVTGPAGPTDTAAATQPGLVGAEVASMRTRFSRTFENTSSGGLTAVVSAAPVNWLDARGAWQPIDDTLSAGATVSGAGLPAGYGWQNHSDEYQVAFPALLSAKPVQVTDKAGWLSFGLVGAQPGAAAVVAGASVSYPGALTGVGLSYAALPGAVKETVSLASTGAGSSVSFAVNASAGVAATKQANGSVSFAGPSGVVGVVQVPYATDAAGVSTSAVSLDVVAGPAAGSWVLTEAVDASWLADGSRVWPVAVDPTVTLNSADADCDMESGSGASTSICSRTTDSVGFEGAGGGGNVHRSVLTFSGLATAVPHDALVQSAQLNLYEQSETTTTPIPVSVYPVSRTWTTSATWNAYDGTNSWTSAGGDYAATPTAALASVGGSAGITATWQVRGIVANWVNATTINNGFEVKSTAETTTNVLSFTSWQSSDTAHWPSLTISFTLSRGLQPYYSMTTHRLTDRSMLAVNNASGNLTVHATDLTLPGVGLGLTVQRYFNSSYSGQGLVGKRWLLSVGSDVHLDAEPDGSVQYVSPSGTDFLFTPGSGGSFVDPAGLNASLVATSSTVYTLTYHSSGEVLTLTDLSGSGSEFDLTTDADRNGNHLTYAYTPTTHHLSTITDTQGRVVTVTYTGSVITKIADPTGRAWTYGYTGVDLTSVTDPDTHATQYRYDSGDNLLTITTAAGTVTTIGTAGYGRINTLAYTDATAASGADTYTFAYQTANNPVAACTGSGVAGITGSTTLTDPNSHLSTFCWDNADRVLAAVDPLSHVRSSTYTANNGVATAVDANGTGATHTTTYSYDALNNPTAITLPTGASATVQYANGGGCTSSDTTHPYLAKCVNDAQHNQATFTYDGPGNTLTSSNVTTGATLTFTYNPAAPTCGGKVGQLCTSTDGNTNVTNYHYDAAGNLTTITPPLPLGATTQTVDSFGRVATVTDGKGQKTTYSYDQEDRITQILTAGATSCTYTAGTCVGYIFDGDGNLSSVHDKTGLTGFGYDQLNRLKSKTLPSTAVLSETLDGAGNVLTYTDPGGTITYKYNAANQLTSLAEPGGSCSGTITLCTTFGLDNNGQRTTTTYPGNTVMTATLDNAGRVTEIKTVNGASTIADFSYSYLKAAADTELAQTRTDNKASLTTTYGYDAKDELTSAVEKNSGGTTTASWLYCYDNAGNRTSYSTTAGATCPGATTTYSYNAANELTALNGVSTGWSYDLDGNETAGASAIARTAETYTAANQLTSITTGGTATAMTYAGLANDERVTAGTTSYQTGEEGLANQTVSSITTSWTRDPGGTLVSERSGTNHYYYVFDGLGSVVALVSSTGTALDTYSYDPYGNTRTSTGTTLNPFQYTASYKDATGLYHNGARYYDPNLGRFTQHDPSGQEANLYAYASDNPATFVDPSGLIGIWACAAAASGLVGVAAGAVAGAPPSLGTSLAVGAGAISLGWGVIITCGGGIGQYVETGGAIPGTNPFTPAQLAVAEAL